MGKGGSGTVPAPTHPHPHHTALCTPLLAACTQIMGRKLSFFPSLPPTDFVDNQDVLDLLEGGGGGGGGANGGVFPLIDEACRLPRATYKVGGCVSGVFASGVGGGQSGGAAGAHSLSQIFDSCLSGV